LSSYPETLELDQVEKVLTAQIQKH